MDALPLMILITIFASIIIAFLISLQKQINNRPTYREVSNANRELFITSCKPKFKKGDKVLCDLSDEPYWMRNDKTRFNIAATIESRKIKECKMSAVSGWDWVYNIYSDEGTYYISIHEIDIIKDKKNNTAQN